VHTLPELQEVLIVSDVKP